MVSETIEEFVVEAIRVLFEIVPTAALALTVAVLGTCVVNRAYTFMKSRMKQHLKCGDPLVFDFAVSSAKIVLKALLYTTVLSMLGIDITSMLCLLSVGALAVAMATTNALENMVGGICILVRREFKEGDFIDVKGVLGHVKATTLFETKVRSLDNKLAHIPNSMFQTNVVLNYTKLPQHRIDIPVRVTYEADLDAVEAEILSVAAKEKRIFQDPAPVVLVKEFGLVGVEVALRCWVENEDFLTIRFAVNKALKKAFDSAGIEFAYYRRDSPWILAVRSI